VRSLPALRCYFSGEMKAFLEQETKQFDVKLNSGDNVIVQDAEEEGEVFITACIDWMNATSGSKKKVGGLDIPHRIDLGAPVYKIFSSSSALHMFIVLNDRKSLYSFGKNDHGQLGTGNVNFTNWPRQVVNPITENITKASLGKSHTLVLFQSGDVYGCGANNCGQLGLGDGVRASADSLVLTKISLDNIRDIACGSEFSLACDQDGRLYSFGHPEYGQLGSGSCGQYIKDGGNGPAIQYNYVSRPLLVNKFRSKDNIRKTYVDISVGDVKVVSVAAGKNHSLCIETDRDGGLNRVFSWGFGGYGRLGHNGADDEFYPLEISTFSGHRNAPMKQVQFHHILPPSLPTIISYTSYH